MAAWPSAASGNYGFAPRKEEHHKREGSLLELIPWLELTAIHSRLPLCDRRNA
jgi:hypothetical protein